MRTFITVLAILLIVFGVFALSYRYFSYTTQEQVAQIGDVQITAANEKTIYFPPVLGGVSIVAGGVLLILSRRK